MSKETNIKTILMVVWMWILSLFTVAQAATPDPVTFFEV